MDTLVLLEEFAKEILYLLTSLFYAWSPFSHGGDRIYNLVFVDDCLIFARATAVAARNINYLFENFSKNFRTENQSA